MLTRRQCEILVDYVRLFRHDPERLILAAMQLTEDDPIKLALLKEQKRRAKELAKLQTALENEIHPSSQGGTTCKSAHTGSQQRPAAQDRKRRKKNTGAKSKNPGDGIYF